MKKIQKYNHLLLFIVLLIQYIKIYLCNDEYIVTDVDPPYIQIENGGESFKNLILTFNHNFTQEERRNQILLLEKDNIGNKETINCQAAINSVQDVYKNNKIIFQLNQNLFLNKTNSYGKYKLVGISINKEIKAIKYEKETILIILNYIKFKNPIHAYELTGENNTIRIRYQLVNEIEEDYIYKITSTDDSNINDEKDIPNFELGLKDNKKVYLIINFQRQNFPKNYTFYIYPEYDKNASKNDIPKLYLHFHDYMLLTDAIYVRNDVQDSLVYFKVKFKNETVKTNFSINDYSLSKINCTLECQNLSCNCSFKLGKKSKPGKLTIENIKKTGFSIIQKRDIFLILYKTPIENCYRNNINKDLEITTYYTNEMEYEHSLYFNDTAKVLTKYEKYSSDDSIKGNRYTAKSSSLNCGTFIIYSLIPDLTTSLDSSINRNPVDDKSLNLTIYPGENFNEQKNSTIYTRNRTDQIIEINSTNAGALNQITLIQLQNKGYQIKISTVNNTCSLSSSTIFRCNLRNMIYDYGDEYLGDYEVYYKSPCDSTDLKIEQRIITIKRTTSLISISPTYLLENEVIGKEITLEYNNNMNNKILSYVFLKKSGQINVQITFEKNDIKFNVNNEFVTINLNYNLTVGKYYILTYIGNEFIISNNSISLNVIKKIDKFWFSHNYFVLNENKEKNHLIIKVNNTTNTFGCRIEEEYSKEELISRDCITFHYYFNKTGQIFFNYYYKDDEDTISIPVNGNITVTSTYLSFFDFSSLKDCYFYKYNINILFFNKYPQYFVFLYNSLYGNISLISIKENQYDKYTYNKTEISYQDIINKNYYLIISERYIDYDVYLYKSTNLISFTDITVPEFIMKPYLTINFSNVYCNLSKSKIEIKKKNGNSISRTISDCQYFLNNEKLSCKINYNNFFSTNNPFTNYSFTIDNEIISDSEEKEKLTFVSNRLNDSYFEIQHKNDETYSKIYIYIINKNCDFYLESLSEITYDIIKNGNNDSFTIYKNEKNHFTIYKENCSLYFKVNDGNLYLDMKYLKRNGYAWDFIIDNSLYYYFKRPESLINNTLFTVEPTVFIYNKNSISNGAFMIKVIFNSDYNLIKEEVKYNNLIFIEQESNILKYFVDINSEGFEKNKAQTFSVYINDYKEDLDFIYYYLDQNSLQCKTKDNKIGNLSLIIDVKNKKYLDLISLETGLLMSIDKTIIQSETNLRLNYTLKGEELSLLYSNFIIYISGYPGVSSRFNLLDLGMNITPIYYMKLENDGKNAIFLPENGQYLKIYIYVKEDAIIDLNDIQEIKINNITFEIKDRNINENTINITLDLKWAKYSKIKDFQLYYIDKCHKPIKTDINISIVSFSVQRKYFVLDNKVNNMKTQKLFIDGPHNDYIKILAYKDHSGIPILVNYNSTSKNYYTEFGQGSKGNYTFKIYNNDIELAKIEDEVYVVNSLKELFIHENNPNCLYLDNKKEALENIIYEIQIENNTYKINNISIFKIKYLSNNGTEFNFIGQNINNNIKRRFTLDTNNNLKREISTNKEIIFYLTERDFIDQPLYAFKLRYTNITLNSDFSEVIYTDASFLSFDMSCKIDNIDNEWFYLNEKPIKCVNGNYDEINKIYRCNLSMTDNKINPLLDWENPKFSYGYSNLTYKNKYLINKKEFYLSHEIETVDFDIKKESQIDVNAYTTVTILQGKKRFYFQKILNVTYNDNLGDNNIKVDFKPNNLENFTFKIYIEFTHKYTINKICRYECNFCYKSDCWNNPKNFQVFSNTKDITFKFNRKYISLNNSTGKKNAELKIIKSGTQKDYLKSIISNYIPLKDGDKSEDIIINYDEDTIIISNFKAGKYSFSYTVEDETDKFIIKDNYLLVANYDYEIFDLNRLNKSCLYYNEESGELFTLITKNNSYRFKNDVNPIDLILIMNDNNMNFKFKSNEEVFQIQEKKEDFKNNYEYSVNLKEEENSDLIFTEIYHKLGVTSFNLDSSMNYFYKDNIVTRGQTCDLDNIYIKEIDSIDTNKSYHKLKCNYSTYEVHKSYCEADYSFTDANIKSSNFEFFIGFPSYPNYFKVNQNKLIYNAIKESTFTYFYKDLTVTLQSVNFDMNHISHIRINENIIKDYSTHFTKINSELIQFEFDIYNISKKSYIKELVRINHDDDIKNITIINKYEEFEIIEKPCDDNFVRYDKFCITCSQLSSIDGSKRIYFQNGSCFEECDFNGGYGVSNRAEFICSKCPIRTKLKPGYYLCGCLEGTVKSFEDDICYLPESPEIKKLLLLKSNTQCYQEDGISYNYCVNETTEECITFGSSGHLFPQCNCKKGYTGKYCELNETDINLQKKIDNILSDENNEQIDETNSTIISNIRGITFFLEKNESEYIKTIETSSINNYINKTIKCLEKMIENNGSVSQIYDVLELALYFLKHKIGDTKTIRSLEEKKDIENLIYIRDKLHYANYLANKDMSQGYNIQTSGLRLVSFINYKKSEVDSDDFKYEMANTTQFRIMEYIDANISNNDYIFVTLINMSLFNNTEGNNDLGVKAYFSTRNLGVNLKEFKDIEFYLSSEYIDFNYQLAQYYQDRKINIYDKKDKAFTEPCYLSKLFYFDLTQKYRKQNIFQKRYYGNENCEYINFESKFNRLIFNCTQFEEFNNIYDLKYGVLTINIKKDSIDNANKVYHLPIKCTKKIDDVGHNMAFWLFLIVCALEVFYIIGINILNLGSLKRISYRKGLIHDELYYHIQKKNYDDEFSSNSEQLKPRKRIVNGSRTIEYEKETRIDVGVDKFYKTFFDCILLNFKELHPIAALCHVSIISPLIIHSWFFVFNTLNLFGFNALIYYEALIEKRIYDKKRNNFDYPMRKEFHKIILSILCQVALCVLIKLLMMVWLEQRNDLKMGLTKCTLKPHEEIDNNVVYRVDLFQNDMLLRRLIGGGIMLLIVTFFFYYSVVFCGIYIKTQSNWFYSGIWSLFWNWVIFAPIYIVIISFIEHKKENSYDPLVYNLKRLFCF